MQQIKNHNNTAADSLNTGTKTMKAKAIEKILKNISEEDYINQITFATTTGVYVLGVENHDKLPCTVDTKDNILCLEDEEGTRWIDTAAIVSIEI